MGISSLVFGILSIFTFGFIFVPLGLLFETIAIFKKDYIWGSLGIIVSIVGTI